MPVGPRSMPLVSPDPEEDLMSQSPRPDAAHRIAPLALAALFAVGVPSAQAGPGVEVLRPPKPTPSWRQQVAAARDALHPRDQRAVVKAIEDGPAPARMVLLQYDAEARLKLSEKAVVHILENTSSGRVARAAVMVLGRRRSTSSRLALADHVERHGRADAAALKVLWGDGPETWRDLFFARAGQATGRDEASLVAIQALAEVPGRDVTQLLQQLAGDRSEVVARTAAKARAQRFEAGLAVRTPMKKVPYGKPMAELLLEAPEVPDPRVVFPPAVHQAPARTRDERPDPGPRGPRVWTPVWQAPEVPLGG